MLSGAMMLFVFAEPLCRPLQFGMVLNHGPVCLRCGGRCLTVSVWQGSRAWCLLRCGPWSQLDVFAIFSTGILVVIYSSVGPLVSMMSRRLLVALSLLSTLGQHLRVLTVLLELFLSVLNEDRHGGGGPVVLLWFPVLLVGSLLLGLWPGACSFG